MASGHVYRANRPNTWLHRPSLQREESSCQLGAVHTWHLADIPNVAVNVRFPGKADMTMSAFDPKRTFTLAFASSLAA